MNSNNNQKKNKEQLSVFHFRDKTKPEKGGVTVVYNHKTKLLGTSVCQKQDNFCRREGFKRAFGRSKSQRFGHFLSCDSNQPSRAEIFRNARIIARYAQNRYNLHRRVEINKIVDIMRRDLLDVDFGVK
ncbi:MAG: hypothetical protein GX660_19115 [Clostridiaceae bacterium]|nr:hypothetical protein [Clostridiaceae bacterium]